MRDGRSLLCLKMGVCSILLVVLSASVEVSQGFFVYGWTGSAIEHSPRQCRTYRERSLYTACPRSYCVRDQYEYHGCCIKERNSGGYHSSSECVCDVSVQCNPSPRRFYDNERPQAQPSQPSPPSQPRRQNRRQGVPRLTKSRRRLDNRRFCTQGFELDFYKACNVDYCSTSNNDFDCCRRRPYLSEPETCVCHPKSKCDVDEPESSDEDSSSAETSSEEECEEGTASGESDECLDEDEDESEESQEESDEDETDEEEEEDEEEAPRSLCADTLRLLNADKVEDPCQYRGIANLTRQGEEGEDVLVCNAVYTIAQVDGVVQRTFLTPQACSSLLMDDSVNIDMDFHVGDQIIPAQQLLFTTTPGPNGNSFVTLNSRYKNLLNDLGTCQDNACPYDPVAMRGKVNFNSCKAVSWGASEASTFETDGLYEVDLAFYPGGCLDQDDFFGVTNTMCFTTVDEENAYCANDAGAPVYCRSNDTEEWILVGILAFQNKCDTSAELKVIPFPL